MVLKIVFIVCATLVAVGIVISAINEWPTRWYFAAWPLLAAFLAYKHWGTD